MTTLEGNGGSDGNSSVAELEVRVEAVEGTAADHEARLTAAEDDIEGDEENIQIKLQKIYLSSFFHNFPSVKNEV